MKISFAFCSLTATGSLAWVSVHPALRFLARRRLGETLVAGPERAVLSRVAASVDPVQSVGFILVCYGVISLALISALPGALALERTCLAFALLCVGGLIGELSSTRARVPPTGLDAAEAADAADAAGKPQSLGVSVALILVLNAAVSFLAAGQDLIDIIPPRPAQRTSIVKELDPIIVVAQRTSDPLERQSGLF